MRKLVRMTADSSGNVIRVVIRVSPGHVPLRPAGQKPVIYCRESYMRLLQEFAREHGAAKRKLRLVRT